MRPRLRAGLRRFGTDAVAAGPPWLVARVVALLALGLAHYLFDHLHAHASRRSLHQGLLSWDADWYRRIAVHGYAHVPRTGVRFFPLYPLAARYLRPVFAGRVDVTLLVIANAAALVYGALLYRLAKRETGDGGVGRRAAWFVALVPPAFTLVMGYAEALAGCLAVAMFLALRSRRWWWAAVAGFLSGLLRPSGALLALPAAIEGLRGVRRTTWDERLGRATAVLAPVAGVGTFLAWVGARFGDVMLPITVQQRSFLRGGFLNPFVALYRAGRAAVDGQFGGNGIHFPLLVVLVVLAAVAAVRLPASYSAFAGATVIVALSARRLGSVERYGFAAFPLLIVLALMTARPRAEQAALTVSSAGMVALGTLAVLGLYIP